jgi:hypothetical protein
MFTAEDVKIAVRMKTGSIFPSGKLDTGYPDR